MLLAPSPLPDPLVLDSVPAVIPLEATRSIEKSDMDGVECGARKISSSEIVSVSLDDTVMLEVWRICLLSMIGGWLESAISKLTYISAPSSTKDRP